MSTGYTGKQTNWDEDVVGNKILAAQWSQWGEIPGKIVDFDPKTQTATIRPLYKPVFNGKAVEMPELLEVPVRFTRAGGGAVTFPVREGDRVTLRPQMRSTENYHTDDDGAASDRRLFNLSDMEAFLDGGESLSDPIKNFDDKNSHVRFDPEGKHGIRGSEDGKIAIEGKEGNIYTLIAEFMELVASDKLQINYGSSAGSGHVLENAAALAAIAQKIRAMAI
jgi:hypothetical protein